jgi:hypothetical protein
MRRRRLKVARHDPTRAQRAHEGRVVEGGMNRFLFQLFIGVLFGVLILILVSTFATGYW